MDRLILRFTLLAHQVVDQMRALLRVNRVQFIAHLALTVLRTFEQLQCSRCVHLVPEQPVPVKHIKKLPHAFRIAKILDREFFICPGRAVAVVEADRDVIADDAPGRIGQLIQVIPALLHRCTAVEFIMIEVGACTFQFDDRDGGDGFS